MARAEALRGRVSKVPSQDRLQIRLDVHVQYRIDGLMAQLTLITRINNAIAKNPAYIQLQSLEALKAISRDPASKVYFIDECSPSSLPLMHLGDGLNN